MSNSFPVVIATDQTAVPVTFSGNQNVNLIQIAGVAPTTAGKIDIKSADGDVFVRQATASNFNATVVGTGTFAVQATEATLDAALIAQEATTSGIKGLTSFGAVTTNAPSYTTARSDALSLDTSGLLRVSLKDTPANTNKFLVTADPITFASAQPVTQSGNWTSRIVGNAGATLDSTVGTGTAPTNQVVVGALYNLTEISPSTGQAFSLQADSKGRLRNVIMDGAGNTRAANVTSSNELLVNVNNSTLAVTESGTWNVGSSSATQSAVPANAFYIAGINGSGNLTGLSAQQGFGDAITPGNSNSALISDAYLFNGTTWDRFRSASSVAGTAGTGLLGAGILAFDNTNYQRVTGNTTPNSINRFGLDVNLVGTLGTIFTTAGLVDIKGTDGNVFIRQATAANLNATVVGQATGSAVPSTAFYSAGNAITSLPTAATAGNLTGISTDKFGRTVVLLGSIRDLTGTQTTTISASTSETTIVTAGGSGVFDDLVMLIVSNTSASTNTRIDFRDTTGGSVLFSLESIGGAAPIGFALPIPIPQTTANTNWTAQCATSTTDVRIYAVFVKNK